MKHERNKNQAAWNANRKRKTRNFPMTDEQHDSVKRLAQAEDKSMTQAVVDAVEEKLQRIGQ